MQKYSILENLLFPPTYLNEEKLRRKLKGKTVLITGASSGIGEKLAYLLADIKIHMILVARTKDKLLTMKSEIEKEAAKVSIYPADLRNKEELESLLTFIHQMPEGLDLVVSNAGKIPVAKRDSLRRLNALYAIG